MSVYRILPDAAEAQAMELDTSPDILWGDGAPVGSYDLFEGANKGSLYLRVDATDDNSHVYMKVDEGGDDNDWAAIAISGMAQAFQFGVFSSSTAGYGIALDATTSVGFGVFVDDNGAAIGSGTLMRAGRFRTLLTYTGGNREQEAVGVIGQINSVGGTNRHNMAGVMGSYELSGSSALTVDGQAYTTDSWIQAAVIGRVGVGSNKTTLNSNGVLAGVAAMSNTTSLASNSGIFTAFYAGRWGGTSLLQWEYALYAQDVAHGAYYNVSAGAVSGEEHGWDLVNTGTLSSGDSLVGVNVVTTGAGTAAAWVSGAYFKFAQASKTVNGYFCAAEFETVSVAVNASDHAVIVLNATNNHTGSVPVSPYIMLRDYGTTHADCFVRIFNDTGQSGTTDATTLATTVGDNYEQNTDYAIRCMLGSTPIWLCASSTAPS